MSDRPDLSPEEAEQIEKTVQRMLCKDLSLHVEEKRGCLIFQLQLGARRIGKRFQVEAGRGPIYLDVI